MLAKADVDELNELLLLESDLDLGLLEPMTREELEAAGSTTGFECMAVKMGTTSKWPHKPVLYLTTLDCEDGTDQVLAGLPVLAGKRPPDEFLQVSLTWTPPELRPAVRLVFLLSCGDTDGARSQLKLQLEALRGGEG